MYRSPDDYGAPCWHCLAEAVFLHGDAPDPNVRRVAIFLCLRNVADFWMPGPHGLGRIPKRTKSGPRIYVSYLKQFMHPLIS